MEFIGNRVKGCFWIASDGQGAVMYAKKIFDRYQFDVESYVT